MNLIRNFSKITNRTNNFEPIPAFTQNFTRTDNTTANESDTPQSEEDDTNNFTFRPVRAFTTETAKMEAILTTASDILLNNATNLRETQLSPNFISEFVTASTQSQFGDAPNKTDISTSSSTWSCAYDYKETLPELERIELENKIKACQNNQGFLCPVSEACIKDFCLCNGVSDCYDGIDENLEDCNARNSMHK